MISLTPILNEKISTPLYQQLFNYIKEAIVNQDILAGDKLPSLRAMSKSLNISVTTVELAYNQLMVEGYIKSRPKSGYYANAISSASEQSAIFYPEDSNMDCQSYQCFFERIPKLDNYVDPASFNFAKWKSCSSKILNEYSHLLLTEGDIQGEPALRDEISKYIYQARGARCKLDQVVIAAGTQQLINLLCIILNRMGIDHVSFENPGYIPVRSIFRDRDFKMTLVPIDKEGIRIEKLPTNIPSVVYVSPSNQFPTGSVMPAARRYALLDWSYNNKSIIIEDDYNSELRYGSRPVPSLQGLDSRDQVVYLGSFSSTLFPSIKISYMVLPKNLHLLFKESLGGYVQTCSKAEQLTLALYMNNGFYQTNLKKQRNLNARKIQIATDAIIKYSKNTVKILNNSSGLHMLLGIPNHGKNVEGICAMAGRAGLTVVPVHGLQEEDGLSIVMFYYTRIPIKNMEKAIKNGANLLANHLKLA